MHAIYRLGLLLLLALGACGGGRSATAPAAPLPTGSPALDQASQRILDEAQAPEAAIQAYLETAFEVLGNHPDDYEGHLALARSAALPSWDAAALDALERAAENAPAFVTARVAGTQNQAKPGEHCDADTVVMYVNGVGNSPQEAMNGLAAVMSAAARYLTADSLRRIEFQQFYNRGQKVTEHDRFPCNLFGLGEGLFGEHGNPILDSIGDFYGWIRDTCAAALGLGTDLVESAVQFLDQYVRAVPDPPQVAVLTQRIGALVAEGKRVVLVAHSQGNFFAQQAIAALGEDECGALSKAVGVIAVASPAGYANRGSYGAFRHFTVQGDILTRDILIPQLGPPVRLPIIATALAPNFPNPFGDDTWLGLSEHSFTTSYLLPGTGTRFEIAETIRLMGGEGGSFLDTPSVENPRTALGCESTWQGSYDIRPHNPDYECAWHDAGSVVLTLDANGDDVFRGTFTLDGVEFRDIESCEFVRYGSVSWSVEGTLEDCVFTGEGRASSLVPLSIEGQLLPGGQAMDLHFTYHWSDGTSSRFGPFRIERTAAFTQAKVRIGESTGPGRSGLRR